MRPEFFSGRNTIVTTATAVAVGMTAVACSAGPEARSDRYYILDCSSKSTREQRGIKLEKDAEVAVLAYTSRGANGLEMELGKEEKLEVEYIKAGQEHGGKKITSTETIDIGEGTTRTSFEVNVGNATVGKEVTVGLEC